MKRCLFLFFSLACVLSAYADEQSEGLFEDLVTGASYCIPFESTIDYDQNNFQKFYHVDKDFVFSIYSNRNPKKKNYSQRDMYRFIEDRDFGNLIKTGSLQADYQIAETYLFQKDDLFHLVCLVPTRHSATYIIETRLDSVGFNIPQIVESGIYEHNIFSNRFERSLPWWIIAIYFVVTLVSYFIGDARRFNWFWTIVYIIVLMITGAFVLLYFIGDIDIWIVLILGLIGLLASPSAALRSFITSLFKD